ncbi:MAG: hypothetical protein HY820_17435, partial [Acidobacteria bacterium]|nr:hypothetical protein [Acidobacteriota bacterium]
TQERVTIQESAATPGVSTDGASNGNSVVIRGKDLDALGDNFEDLAADLQALAGPSAGPSGGQIYIDGFTGGALPSKESIREIRINQNPFSPEYDKMGFGRIEILTKPGSEKWRFLGYYNFADDFWNSRNPYAAQKAPFLLKEYGGTVSGPLGKHAAMFWDIRRDSIDNGAVINGITLDPQSLAVIDPYTAVHRIPQRRITVSPRFDVQAGAKNTLTFRYGYMPADIRDSMVGVFNLPSRGVHASGLSQIVRAANTHVVNANVINETRFQYIRTSSNYVSNSFEPSLLVLGAFNGGGSHVGRQNNTQNNFEGQNYISMIHKAHTLRFGTRIRGEKYNDFVPANFGGTFTFGGGVGPQLDAKGQLAGAAQVTITSIERYRRTLLLQRQGLSAEQIRALGGGATQFTISAGTPALAGGQTDVGVFFGDEWRARSNLTLSLGLRYEAQTNIGDRIAFAPRLGVAWAPGAKGKARQKTVLRSGFGMFYDRFPLVSSLTALRYGGVIQQQYVVSEPDFFPFVPSVSSLPRSISNVQRLSNSLRAPYVMQGAASVERELPWKTTVAVTYAGTRGLHRLRSQNINAPLPGTYNPAVPSSGVYPNGAPGAVFLIESSGLYNQHQMIVSVNNRVNAAVSLFGSYVLNQARSNTDSLSTAPAKPYSMAGEYGPAATDVRQRVTFGGNMEATRWKIQMNPLLTMETGPPFDITVGRDLYGTTLFNGRPGFATDPDKAGVVRTSYGLLDPNPTPDQVLLGRNYGRGPGSVFFNLRVGKSWSFGIGEGREAPTNIPGGAATRRDSAGVFNNPNAGGPARINRKYNITVSMSVRNLLNHNNPGPIIGNITSPLFGLANQPAGANTVGGTGFSESANNRRLELQTRITF